eukprot:TRINITY_DN2197_c2_g1_i1.p1 TRINITY_DN2197_c2_g1~~TRINITY_DN2197_c2_g1_i1.p1  ORF type:complete len:145 (+),score=5.87 TRINITY_DN2197_c2_g1_i1:832-1266(+)
MEKKEKIRESKKKQTQIPVTKLDKIKSIFTKVLAVFMRGVSFFFQYLQPFLFFIHPSHHSHWPKGKLEIPTNMVLVKVMKKDSLPVVDIHTKEIPKVETWLRCLSIMGGLDGGQNDLLESCFYWDFRNFRFLFLALSHPQISFI